MYLVGVHHGVGLSLGGFEIPDISYVGPSKALMNWIGIASKRKKTRIGIEKPSPEAVEKIDDFAKRKARETGTGFGGFRGADYFNDLEVKLGALPNTEIVCLEGHENYSNFISIKMERAKKEMEFCENFGNFDEEEKAAAILKHVDEAWKTEAVEKKILVLDRDDEMARKIVEEEVDFAIVGLGHSNHWMLNQEEVREKYGLVPDFYSTDKKEYAGGNVIDKFSVFGEVERDFSFEEARRQFRVATEGRVTGEKPDFVGTWDFYVPSRGYFEVFEDEKRIEDGIGSASYVGNLSGVFLKSYDTSRCSEKAIKVVKYDTEKKKDYLFGYHNVGAFVMKAGEKADPVDMVLKALQG